MHLSRPIGNLDRCTIPASLGGAVLNLSDIGHGSKQPDSRRHQHDKESKYHRSLEVAIALVVRRLRLCASSACHLSITASEDRDERHRNSRRHDSAFPHAVHALGKKNFPATDNSDRPAPCRGRREYRARTSADIPRRPCPATPASVPAPAPALCADAPCRAPPPRGVPNVACWVIRPRSASALPASRRCH